MQNFYGIKLLTKREYFENENGELYCQKYCFENNYISIGYQTDGHPEIDTKENYENFYKNDTKWQHLYKRFSEINKDSYIWVKKDARTYYLGKITDTVPSIPKDNWIQKIGLVRKCIWVKNIEFDEIPGCIINQFSGRNKTLWQIRKISDSIKKYCTWLYETKINDINQNIVSLNLKGCIKELIHYDDLEDLVGIYLQVHGYKDTGEKYIIHPSTNKLSTKTIEYELRSYNGKKAGVQCKTGDSNIDDDLNKILYLIKNENYTIYVCVMSGGEKYNNINDNLKQIDFNELIEWASENDNMSILPTRIQHYIKLTSI